MATTGKNLAILIFDDVEVLDFCGPFEVFSVANRFAQSLRVFTIAERLAPVVARHGLSVNPDYALRDCPDIDWLLIPGGLGARKQADNGPLIQWIAEQAASGELVMSVCTGALLLGAAGLLNGISVTTHHGALDLLRERAPKSTVESNRRYIDTGKIVTSAGIAAGIDMSLHVVAQRLGTHIAVDTAAQMEYPWQAPAAP